MTGFLLDEACNHDQNQAFRYVGFFKTSPAVFNEVEERSGTRAIKYRKVRGDVAGPFQLLVDACFRNPKALREQIL